MRKTLILAFAAFVLLAFAAYGYCEQNKDIVEQIGNGSINWSKGVIQTIGIGAPPEDLYGKPNARPMAIRDARLDALRNLLKTTKGVRIDSSTKVKDFAVENDVIMSKVEGMVRDAQIVKREYLSDGTVGVVMQMSLYGGFAQLVLPSEIKQVDSVKQVKPARKKSVLSDLPDKASQAVYTGLVVDARGINARPAMAVTIFDENGEEIYGPAFVSREFAVRKGMSGYVKSINAALKDPRVTDNPLTVKGLKTKGAGKSDIVISNADAAKLRDTSDYIVFLKKCRVIIVID